MSATEIPEWPMFHPDHPSMILRDPARADPVGIDNQE